jgi:hypothetical protein
VPPPVEPVDAPVDEPAVEPVVEPVDEPVVEPVAEPVVEPVDEPVVEPVDDPVVVGTKVLLTPPPPQLPKIITIAMSALQAISPRERLFIPAKKMAKQVPASSS